MARTANSFVAAIVSGDAGRASGAYAAQARLLAPSAELIEGRDAIAAFWRAGIDAGIREVERMPLRVEQRGSVAFEFGRYAIRVEPADGLPLVDRGKYLLVHELVGGTWEWAVETLSPDGPPVRSDSLRRRRDDGEVADG